jgi:cell division septal protein FtsQ
MKITRKNTLHTPEFQKKKRRARQKKTTIVTVIVLIIIVLPSIFLHLHKFYITDVLVEGNTVTPTENIKREVESNLSGNYFFVYPKRNFLIYPKSMIERNLMDSIPRLDSVSVEMEKKVLHITVSERKPVALYCKDISNITMPTGCYFFDDNGYIFSESPSFSGDVYFIYTSEPSYDDPLRQKFFQENAFHEIADFVASLEHIGIHGRAFVDKGDEYDLILSNGGRLIWNKEDKLRDIESNLEAFLSDPSIQEDKNFLNKILYLDLRFPNKVFYKFQGAE